MPFVQTNASGDFRTKLEANLIQMKTCISVSSKMEMLYTLSKLTSDEYRLREELRSFVQRTLKPFYPNCEVHIYGSSNNGFGSKGCDVDLLFLPHPEYSHLGLEDELDDLPTPQRVKSGEIHHSYLLKMGEKSQLWFIKNILKKKSYYFWRIVFIPAKCPILNFVFNHVGYQFFCDLSCQNKLVVYNTELLRFLGDIDSRVCPLVFTLCSWAKSLKHIQSLNFSTYAFTLMVIFFLQTLDPPILPSVDFLMNESGCTTFVANWKVGFNYDISNVPKSKNESNNEQLLQQFFNYYWNFEFNKSVVCIRRGHAVPLTYLNEIRDEWENFEVSAVCVQDPFNLSHNVTRNVKPCGLRSLKLSLFEALKILQNSENTENFEELFDESKYTVTNNFSSIFGKQSVSLVIDLNYETVFALEKLEIGVNKWYCYLSEIIFQILNQSLLFESEVIDKVQSNFELSTNKLDGNGYSNSHPFDNIGLILSIQCAVYSRVWSDRKNVTTKLESLNSEDFESIIEKEEYISNYIASDPLLCSATPLFWCLCHCYKSNVTQIPCLIVEFSPLTVSKEFKTVAAFLSHFIPKTLHKVLCKEI